MSWDQAYNELRKKLGREPTVAEIQNKMLEIARARLEEPQNNQAANLVAASSF